MDTQRCGQSQEEKDELQFALHSAVQAIYEHNHLKKQTARQKAQHFMEPEVAELTVAYLERAPTWQDWPQRLWALRTRERFIPLPQAKKQAQAANSQGSEASLMSQQSWREGEKKKGRSPMDNMTCPVCHRHYQELQAHILETCHMGNKQRKEWQQALASTLIASVNHKVADMVLRSQVQHAIQTLLPIEMKEEALWCNNMPLITSLGTITHSLLSCLEPLDKGAQKSITQDMQRIIAIKGEGMIYAFQKRTGAYLSTSLTSL